MSKPIIRTSEMLESDIRRLIRLYPREQVTDKIVEYVTEGWEPKEVVELRKEMTYMAKSAPKKKIRVIKKICMYYKVDFDYIKARVRNRDRILMRKIAMYMLCEQTTMSLSEIGKFMSLKNTKPYDHTTVMYHRQEIKEMMRKNADIRRVIISINQIKVRV